MKRRIMAKRARFYVGRKNQIMEVIASRVKPTKTTHPHHDSFIGPFRTLRGANHMANFGVRDGLQTVTQAENAAAADCITV
jgi:hypothetical protein